MSQRIAALLLCIAAQAGCGGSVHQATRVDPRPRVAALQANFTVDQLRMIDTNCPLGRPKPDPAFNFGPTRFVIREGYVLEHSSQDKIPLWVCEGIQPAQLGGSLDRSNAFHPDPQLPAGQRAELKDYKGSGFDRGHMAPAGDQTVDATRKDETFFLSNMSPQVPAMNQRIWAALEGKARDWLTARGGGWILTGPLFYDPKEDNPATADGFIDFSQIGPGNVAVPTHFYKIVVARNAAGAFEAIGFVMENRSFKTPFDFSVFIKSIDWIEEHAGIDFLPELAATDEARVEGATPPIWTP